MQIATNSIIFHEFTDAYEPDSVNLAVQVTGGRSEMILVINRTRNLQMNIEIDLQRFDAVFNCIGIYIMCDAQLHINFKQIHGAARTEGMFFLSGACWGSAHIYFDGTLTIEPTAQASIGSMTHKALICSPGAYIKTVPNLEIKTNNVSCKHAATVQQLDNQSLFYLASRGITYEKARSLVIEGFLREGKKHVQSEIGKNFFISKCA